jgi:hypothetical protein
MAEKPADRFARLTDEIAAARKELEARQDLEWADAGAVVDALSHDLNQVTHLYPNDEAAAHARYDAVEQRLGELRARVKGQAGG